MAVGEGDQGVGAVGEDAVDPEIEQLGELGGVVGGVGVDDQATLVGGGQQRLVDVADARPDAVGV